MRRAALLSLPVAVGAALPIGEWRVTPASGAGTGLRHCSFDLYSTAPSSPAADFVWSVKAALSGDADSVSFESTNYPGRYISPSTKKGLESGRLGINSNPNATAASWKVVPGLSDKSMYSFVAADGRYLALDGQLKGDCSGHYVAGSDEDVAAVAAPDAARATFRLECASCAEAVVDAAAVTHTVDPLYMGCHSDSGYTHQARGFSSQLLFGESFEPAPGEPQTWQQSVKPAGATAELTVDGSGVGLHGQTALRVNYTAGSGMVGMANRGLGNEGLFLQAGREYEGYFFAKSAQAARVSVALMDHLSGAVLASQNFSLAGGADWTRFNFTMVPSGSTPCEGIAPGSDPSVSCGKLGSQPGHICVRCGGQFVVGLAEPAAGEVLFDFVWLQPGAWGRYHGLPVLKDTIDTLQSIGVTAIRQGGSFTIPKYYFWKNWRGNPWERPSVGATWGQELISSWGPFEMVDLCNSAGFEAIITTTADSEGCCAADDMADLVEYCWGNSSTKWGAQRVADGHPQPFNVRYFELGNEQYNHNYVAQVRAMEQRAKALGKGGDLYYIFPNNGKWLSEEDGDAAEELGLGDHLLSDFHVGGGGAVAGSEKLFASTPKWTEGSLNLETNAGSHTMSRAVAEAADLNAWFSSFVPSTSADKTSRIKSRTASFCTERSGHYDAFDQGITFFLPNMTWVQPPGYVHKMIADSWMPSAVSVNVTGSLSVSAQKSADGAKLRLLVVNSAESPGKLQATVRGFAASNQVNVTTLSGAKDSANTPAQPTLISPRSSVQTIDFAGGASVGILPYSFTILLLSRQ